MNRFDWERHTMAQPFNGEATRVLWAYASHADSETLITFPTIRQVADATGVSVEKVGRYRTELLATGWLVESDEKTSRGNPKLVLAVGDAIASRHYLGEKKAVSARSMSNLIPAAKQKKDAGSLDTPDEAGLEHREGTGLEHREIQGLDTPDVTTSINNHIRTTNNNHASADAPVGEVRESVEPSNPSLIALADGTPDRPKKYWECTEEEKAERDKERLAEQAAARAARLQMV